MFGQEQLQQLKEDLAQAARQEELDMAREVERLFGFCESGCTWCNSEISLAESLYLGMQCSCGDDH